MTTHSHLDTCVLTTGLYATRWHQALVKQTVPSGWTVDHPRCNDPLDGHKRMGIDAEALQLCNPRHRLRQRLEDLDIPAERLQGSGKRLIAMTMCGRHNDYRIIGDRDITIRQGHTAFIAESPAPNLSDSLRAEMHRFARLFAEHVRFTGVCDLFFSVIDSGRLALDQIVWGPALDHDVYGVDLFSWALDLTADLPAISVTCSSATCSSTTSDSAACGITAIICATGDGSLRCTGIRSESVDVCAVTAGDQPKAQPIACCTRIAASRELAYAEITTAIAAFRADGIRSNQYTLVTLTGIMNTRAPTASDAIMHAPSGPMIAVIHGGFSATVQDRGRLGHWNVGVPPSGPMDGHHFDLANRCVGNTPDAAALEITLGGGLYQFGCDTVIALTGAATQATINGRAINFYEPIQISAGEQLHIGPLGKHGLRTYVAIRGGIDTVPYLDSRGTFTLGGFGGFGGRELKAGDHLPLGNSGDHKPQIIPMQERGQFSSTWTIAVTYGPHGSPDFFTPADIDDFFTATWKVSPQSNRTGVRLIGPKPTWARSDGGEAGLHPSNIHDNAYALGSIDFTGDMPVVLGPDGPSLGGFVCPAVITSSQRWKLGQLRPGDQISFKRITREQADDIRSAPASLALPAGEQAAIISHSLGTDQQPAVCFRRAGDDHILVEFGPLALDIALRMRIQAVVEQLEHHRHPAFIDLTPGIRSLQVHYDPQRLHESAVVKLVQTAIAAVPNSDDLTVSSRIVHLPLSWDDPSTRKAIDIYTRTVNPDAPWCPWNIEFIRRVNGLASVDDVKRIVFDAKYLVLGLGDVYLGAPVATPVDPRHRLVTTKYNPARTWTPENAVGIGGAYMCIYGMEGPGGYQFVGRTIQVWNSWHETPEFLTGTPWLLRQFDRIAFFPVSAEELLEHRRNFPLGQYPIRIEEGQFSLREYRAFLADNDATIRQFTTTRDAAFAAERERWTKQAAAKTPALAL